MLHHCPSYRSGASDNIKDASRYARLDRQLSESQRGQRSLAGWLPHDRIAASQRRTELPRSQQQRKIPWNDQPNHAYRFAQRVRKSSFECVDRLAVDLGRQTSVISQNVNHHRHVDVARLENRLAVVEGLKLGQLVDIFLDQVGKFPDQTSTFAGRHLSPRTIAIFKSTPGSIDCAINVRARTLCDLGQHFAGSRIDGVECLRTINPLPVDQQLARLNFYLSCKHSFFPVASTS